MLKILPAATLLLFIVMQTVAYAANCEGQKGRVLFEDNFTTDSGGWRYHPSASWDTSFGKAGLALRIQEPTTNWRFLNVIHAATEADFCTEVVMPKGAADDVMARIGLLFLAYDDNDFYLLLIGSDTPTPSNQQRRPIELWKKDGKNWGKLGDWSDPKIKTEPGLVVALRVVVKANQITAFVNGVEVKKLRVQLPEGNRKFGVYVETSKPVPAPGMTFQFKRYKLTAGDEPLASKKSDSAEDRKQEEQKKQQAEADKRFAATCNPLRGEVISVLRSAGVAFNEAFRKMKEVQTQLRGSCPEAVQTFGGFVEKIVNCYNGTWLLRLSDGTYYSFPPGSTYLFGQDQPWAIGELVTGLTAGVHHCVSSISPTIVHPSLFVTAAARRKWDDGDRAKLLSDRATIQAQKNERLEARIAELDQQVARNPNDAAAFAALGTAYLEKGDYRRALEKTDMAIVLEPGNAVRMNERCWARALADQQLREGLNDCNKSLELQPNDPNALDSRGYIYLRLGEYDRAIADFDAGLQNHANWNTWASSAFGRGIAKRRKGDSTGGNEDIKKALEIKLDIDDTMAFFGFK